MFPDSYTHQDPLSFLKPFFRFPARRVPRLSSALALVAAFLLVFFASSLALAQTFTGGGIGGQVTDPKALAVSGVKVQATEIATGTTAETVSDANGDYLIQRLKPGIYRVAFTAASFKEAIEDKVTIQLDLTYRLDKKLTLGSTSESVEVAASDSSINYDSPEISSTLSAEQVEELPQVSQSTRGRSPYLLAMLAPGVTSSSAGNNNVNRFSLGGGRPVTNDLVIDGLPSTNPSDNTYTYTPSPESVEELKVTTTPFSAEFGHTGGGVILINTRHGGKDIHGSVYSYFNNRLMNARGYFSGPNQRYDQNDPGFNLSGPIVIPHLLRPGKTFFFTDVNYSYSATPSNSTYRTPTDAERSGDFSADSDVAIYDPATTTHYNDSKGNLVIQRSAFAGNKIPTARVDSVASQLVKYFPEPNGNYGSGLNYKVDASNVNQITEAMVRVDHTISDKDTIFARYGRYAPNNVAVTTIPNAANPGNGSGWYDNQTIVSETHIFNPTSSNDFRFGLVQEVNYTHAGGPFPSSLGLTGVPTTEFPNIATDNYIGLGAGGPYHDRDRSYIFVDNLLFQFGRHYLKVGGDYRHQMYKVWNNNGNVDSGTYTFDSTFTQTDTVDGLGVLTGNSGGFDLAGLLLGLPTSTSIVSDFYTYRQTIDSASLYAQDDWKITPKLTANLGLRWEYDGPYSEANNQFASFSPTKINAQTGNAGDAIFAGKDGAPTHFQPNIFYNFLPRVGLVWNPIRDTVVRGGMGLYRLPSIGFSYLDQGSIYEKNASIASTDGYTPVYQLSQGVPSVAYYRDANGNPEIPASLSDPSSTPIWIDGRSRTPYSLISQLGVERQFGPWFFSADYVYNHGIKLPVLYSADQLLPSQYTAAKAQSNRPFPQYADVQYFTNQGGSNYQALEAELKHNWKNGLVISFAYTFSKLLDDVDANDNVGAAGVQNTYNFHAEHGMASSNVPQRLVSNFVYKLPFGRGAKFANHTTILRDVIADWQISGIVQLQVGEPIKITQNDHNPFTAAQRPNLVGSPTLAHAQKSLSKWFNTSAFTAVSIGTLGNSPRFPLNGPGINRTDFSLKRTFPLGERVKLDIRGDFDNIFNHPSFSNPNGNVNSSSFGVVSGAQSPRIGQIAAKINF